MLLVEKLKGYFNSYKNNSFIKNVATISSGKAISQGILVLSAPILTRIFPPDVFGIFAVYSASAAILAKLFTLQFDMAIVLPEEEDKAKKLFKLSVKISFWFFVIGTAISSIAFFFPILSVVGLEEIPIYVPFISVIGAFVLSLKHSFNYLNIRYKKFQLISVAVVVASIFSQSYKIIGGTLYSGAIILISGTILAIVSDIMVQIVYGKQGDILKKGLLFSIKSKESKKLIKEYIDFPKYRMGQSLLNLSGQRVPEILLVSFFNPAVAGFYSLANRTIQQPGTLISQAVNKVFYKDAAELRNKGTGLFRSMFKKTLWLAAVGIIPFGIIILFAPALFAFVFGNDWQTAGVYASYISFWMYTVFCNTPSSAVMPVLRQQRRYLISNSILFVSRVFAIIVGAYIGGALEAIICLTIIGVIYNIFIIIDVHWLAYKDEYHI